MAKSCKACEDLRTNAPSVLVNGIDETACTSLKNNTGLNPSTGTDDCADLEDLNDCLVGNMVDEIDAYDVCDWKEYMKKFVPNVYNVFKGIICAICGIWTNIKNLWDMANRIDCIVEYVTKGASFSFGELTSTGKSYIVAGRGVSFANVGATGTSNDISITYVAGGISYLTGSCKFYKNDFTDREATANFDEHGTSPTTGTARKGNSKWDDTGYLGSGGELAYELRIKKSEYPQIKRFWNGLGDAGAGGSYEVMLLFRDEGKYAPGQTGYCDADNGDPVGAGADRGHQVPEGWMYIQVRIKYLETFGSDGTQYTPVCLIPMRINQNEIKC